ncbi:hypothetical protein LJB88_03470 [Erysipelotrichaceae bacterium OttesenSCG-928-M19]|nr:hypothetical protein [Erysipelotrichaceae bacterium OttesenSCG-928-M19]
MAKKTDYGIDSDPFVEESFFIWHIAGILFIALVALAVVVGFILYKEGIFK